MPFITKERREIIAKHGMDGLATIEPGDRCYVFYKDMVEKWRATPRWATAHQIMKDFLESSHLFDKDVMVAHRLAWEVFFQLHVMPYELKKREENGDV